MCDFLPAVFTLWKQCLHFNCQVFTAVLIWMTAIVAISICFSGLTSWHNPRQQPTPCLKALLKAPLCYSVSRTFPYAAGPHHRGTTGVNTAVPFQVPRLPSTLSFILSLEMSLKKRIVVHTLFPQQALCHVLKTSHSKRHRVGRDCSSAEWVEPLIKLA